MFGAEAWAGTGGINMLVALDINQVITFILQGCLYSFGINVGPAYLSGYSSIQRKMRRLYIYER